MSQRALTLHHSPWQGVLYVTGGGTELLSELLTTPGASRTVLEAFVPYTPESLAERIGGTPDQACSASTARALAMAAFQRARLLGGVSAFGLGCTASLATDREKKGAHRAHVSIQTIATTYNAEILLEGDRAAEEDTLVAFLWHALDQALALEMDVSAPEAPRVDTDRTHAQAHWRALILGETQAVASAHHDGGLLFPGAFNPLHHAHARMLEIAEQRTGLSGAFELSIVNVDKPLLDYTEIEARLSQFSAPVWLTRLPTFLEKARHFPGAHFVLGIDTLLRLVEPRYYGTTADRDRALEELHALGSRFVVFGREHHGAFRVLEDITLPAPLRSRCIGVRQADFHEPISSSDLRKPTP